MSAKRRVTGRDPRFGGHRRLVLGYRLARVLQFSVMVDVAYYRIARHRAFTLDLLGTHSARSMYSYAQTHARKNVVM